MDLTPFLDPFFAGKMDLTPFLEAVDFTSRRQEGPVAFHLASGQRALIT